MIPLSRPDLGERERALVLETLGSGWVAQGPRVAALEGLVASYVGARHAVAFTSCTTALFAALRWLGIGPGDEVICPSLSFIATANSVAHTGAEPVFADVDRETMNLDAASVEACVTGRTRAVMLVHQVGVPADLDAFRALARRHGLRLVEDAACALGSRWGEEPIGWPHGDLACFSFHPRKVVTTGEGGLITTPDPEAARFLRLFRHHGMDLSPEERQRGSPLVRERYLMRGYNLRMSDLQAALGVAQVERLDAILGALRARARRYDLALAEAEDLRPLQARPPGRSNHQSYVVRLRRGGRARRDAILEALYRAGVGARPGISPAHREPAYADRPPGRPLPETEAWADESFLLPLYSTLTEEDQDRVIRSLLEACR